MSLGQAVACARPRKIARNTARASPGRGKGCDLQTKWNSGHRDALANGNGARAQAVAYKQKIVRSASRTNKSSVALYNWCTTTSLCILDDKSRGENNKSGRGHHAQTRPCLRKGWGGGGPRPLLKDNGKRGGAGCGVISGPGQPQPTHPIASQFFLQGKNAQKKGIYQRGHRRSTSPPSLPPFPPWP